MQGDLMAAGVTYFAFLGLFPVLLLVASIFGLFLAGDALLQQQLFDAIREAFPGALGEQLVHEVSVRGRQRRRHRPDRPGRLPVRGAADGGQAADRDGADLEGRASTSPTSSATTCRTWSRCVVLGGIGLVSLALTGAVTQATSWVLELLGLDDGRGSGVLTWLRRPRPGRRGGRRRLPLAAAGRAVGLLPAAPAAARRAVRSGRLRGAQAARRLLPVADLRQRDRVGLRRRRGPARLDQPGGPVLLLHGRVDGDPPSDRGASRSPAAAEPVAA